MACPAFCPDFIQSKLKLNPFRPAHRVYLVDVPFLSRFHYLPLGTFALVLPSFTVDDIHWIIPRFPFFLLLSSL